ncbi:lipid-A-disaccharide synthase [Lewinella sp. LCG006]|uniref:lipid-A-disaccharide synthase n=1 Tax=Lewinella sp. LCG006 TaxID=3231911 RepID=UPI00345FD7BE
MKYYLIAGEASGDLHGAYLINALAKIDPDATFRGWGGDMMAAAGADLQKHYRELAFMGFVEVLLNIRTILGNFKTCKEAILAYQPDVLILVDYPGFNLRIAKWAKQQGIKVFYYISPQIWAWHSSRVHQIKANVDEMFVILPFEQDFYAKYGMEVNFVGHPLLDVIRDHHPDPDFRQKNKLSDQPIIALLPGSRKQEISRMLSVLLATADNFPDYQFVVAGAPSQDRDYYLSLFAELGRGDSIKLVQGQTYTLLQNAEAALVTSGTATLETALLECPQIVCYRGSSISYAIAKRVINVKYISLVNLIMDEELVVELIQDEFNVERTTQALNQLLKPSEKARIATGYQGLKTKLGDGGAANRCAKLMVEALKK